MNASTIESDSEVKWTKLSGVECFARLYLSKAACLKGFSRLKRASGDLAFEG